MLGDTLDPQFVELCAELERTRMLNDPNQHKPQTVIMIFENNGVEVGRIPFMSPKRSAYSQEMSRTYKSLVIKYENDYHYYKMPDLWNN